MCGSDSGADRWLHACRFPPQAASPIANHPPSLAGKGMAAIVAAIRA
jgi:hypothetical protein